MNEPTPTYTLKKPLQVLRVKPEKGSFGHQKGYEEIIAVLRPDGSLLMHLYPDEFEELFERVGSGV